MPDPHTKKSPLRFIFAADAVRFSPQEMRRAFKIADSLMYELHAVWMEDSNLTELAKLPFTEEVGVYLNTPRNFCE
jgi:hypothetical protein